MGSLAKAYLDKPLASLMPIAQILEKQYQILFGSYEDPLLRNHLIPQNSWSPTRALKDRMFRNEMLIQSLAGNVENVNAYYGGRCTGDGAAYFASLLEMLVGSGIAGSGGAAMVVETASGVGLVATPATMAVVAVGAIAVVDDGAMALHQVDMIREDMGRYQESKKNGKESDDKNVDEAINSIPDSLKKYGKCNEFAQKLVDTLEKKGISYKIIRVDSEYGIYSDKAATSIGQGFHYGVQVGDIVYDNMTPHEMELSSWLRDLGLTQGFDLIRWSYVNIIINK